MTICFNSKGNPVKTYDEWQRSFWKERMGEEDETPIPDGSLIGDDE